MDRAQDVFKALQLTHSHPLNQMIMQTFRHSRAILFCKEDCLPCVMTKDSLYKILADHPEYRDNITVLRKERQVSLVGAYKIELFPTLVIVDPLGEEQGKIVGGKNIREQLKGILFALNASTK